MATPLTDAITALTTYANGITGKSDANLPDAVRSLADGYGGGSGLEYEEGTYTPATDEFPTISFANSHTKAPDIIVFGDVASSWQSPNTGAMNLFVYVAFSSLFGVAWQKSDSVSWANGYFYGRIATNGTNTTIQSSEYTRGNVSASGFEAYAGANTYTCKAGHTYKWIAIWK